MKLGARIGRSTRGLFFGSVALVCASCVGSVELRVVGPGEDCARDFGSSTAAAKIETFLAASRALATETEALASRTHAACAAGLATSEASEPTSCTALAAWITDEQRALTVSGLRASEPRCAQDEAAFGACVSRCELRYRPEDVNVVVDASGLLTAPQASPRCRASCETLGAIAEQCTPPASVAELGDGGDPARLARLHTALEHAAEALALAGRAERIRGAADRLVSIAPVLPEAAATVSIRAVACVSAASIDIRTSEDRLAAIQADTAPLGRLVTPP
ncbi:MAG: hypothetical protein U0353_27850 [Sandaracinus sp.]